MRPVRFALILAALALLAAFYVRNGPRDRASADSPASPAAAAVTTRPEPLEAAPTGADVPPAERPRDADPAESGRRAPAGSDQVAESRDVAEPTGSVERGRPPEATRAAPTRSERRRRWSRRWESRYPGPIPTPADWKPPKGPTRIGLQAGHWKADEAPRELSGLRDNGTSWRGTPEWKVNLEIARRAGALLEERGYQVDILPAVVPPSYRAHLFISIHSDGSNDPDASGYRVATPRRDATGRAEGIATLLERTYGEATGLPRIPTVTRRMRNYYAFNFRRYEHALDPMTIGVIIETGFLTSARDRRVIMNDPQRAARGIVEAVEAFPDTPPPDARLARQEGR